MPEISRFFGIVIAVFYADHAPPHFHARYGEHRAIIGLFRRWSEAMMVDVVEVRALEGYRVFVRFEDGVQGEIDVSEMVTFEGVFAPLRDPARFAEVRVHPELRTVYWPNGADLDPDVLYSRVSGKPIRVPRLLRRP